MAAPCPQHPQGLPGMPPGLKGTPGRRTGRWRPDDLPCHPGPQTPGPAVAGPHPRQRPGRTPGTAGCGGDRAPGTRPAAPAGTPTSRLLPPAQAAKPSPLRPLTKGSSTAMSANRQWRAPERGPPPSAAPGAAGKRGRQVLRLSAGCRPKTPGPCPAPAPARTRTRHGSSPRQAPKAATSLLPKPARRESPGERLAAKTAGTAPGTPPITTRYRRYSRATRPRPGPAAAGATSPPAGGDTAGAAPTRQGQAKPRAIASR